MPAGEKTAKSGSGPTYRLRRRSRQVDPERRRGWLGRIDRTLPFACWSVSLVRVQLRPQRAIFGLWLELGALNKRCYEGHDKAKPMKT